MPRPRPETQEQVDKTEGERGLSPLPEALSGQPSPGWKPENILHMCACVCTPGHSPTGAYTHPCMHIHHTWTQPHTGKHMLHTHTQVHRCSHVAVCVHIGACTHMCTCVHGYMCVHVCALHTYRACMQPHMGRHTNACVRMHMRRPTGLTSTCMCVYTCVRTGIGAGVRVCTHRYMHAHA